ncbi:hypothetical protein ACFSR9_13145 [Deinococcus taklimakanensis]|uniref:Uncharacterized protein n=1 Tax=Deinococcus taklimakanensis TaxID=536443 RepID=A0ABW5P5J2_9DEIO
MTQDKPRNITRTWHARIYGGWGDGPSARVLLDEHEITLSADEEGRVTAVIDGQVQDAPRRAAFLLAWARTGGHLCLIHEERRPEPLPTDVIGKARACTLHRIMGMAGLPKSQHYSLSAAALGEPWPLESLATLTEAEARTVWEHLCRVYPLARDVARTLKPPHPALRTAAA